MASKKKDKEESVVVSPPNNWLVTLQIIGTSPYCQARFAEKARRQMQAKHEAGSTAKKGQKKEARNFADDYEGARHQGPKGESGIPAAAFRSACISACRLVNFKMTLAKLGLFIEADFFDPRDGTPLVRLEGEPQPCTLPVRNATGVADLRCRPMWHAWKLTLRVKFDSDLFTANDVINLIARAGEQVGIGEGRADSKKSAGMGWGHFRIDPEAKVHIDQLDLQVPQVA